MMRRMRLAVGFVVLLLAVACGNALAQTKSLQLNNLQGAPGPIKIISARFGTTCKGPSDDVTTLFQPTCDGKWRCIVRSSRQLSAKQKAVVEVARETGCAALYLVDWICGDDTGKRSLRDVEGARFRLSCPRPVYENDGDSAAAASEPAVQPAAASLPASGSRRGLAAGVHGRFLATPAAGVADHKIVIGRRQTLTDEAGVFRLSDLPATYDLSVIDKDGAKVTLFLGLTRREPVVAQAEWNNGWRVDLGRGAFISGRLAGPELAEAGGRLRATSQFFSARKPVPRGDAGFFQRASYPGDIGRNPISWRGPPTISGRLLALIHHEGKGDDYRLVGIASKTLTFEDGDNVSEDLTAIKLSWGHIAGTWNPAENPQAKALSVSYQLGDGSGEFWVGACHLRDSMGRVLSTHGSSPVAGDAREQPFDCPLPDVTVLPGRYRAFLVEKYGSVLEPEREHPTTCNIEMGGTAVPCGQAANDVPKPTVPATTKFTSPPDRQFTAITSDSRFEWKPRKNSVYAIDLVPNRAFNLVPKISLFTRKTSLRWSDLTACGIGFPTGAVYMASVTSIPVSSVDQVASLDWWYGRSAGNQQPESSPSGVRLADPAASALDPRAPSNVKDLTNFPSDLPVCGPGVKGEVLDAGSFGRIVTITGNLGRVVGECTHVLAGRSARDPAPNCRSYWAITDVAGSSLPVSLVRPADSSRWGAVPVAATGLLTLDPGEHVPVLEQANLCVSPAKP